MRVQTIPLLATLAIGCGAPAADDGGPGDGGAGDAAPSDGSSTDAAPIDAPGTPEIDAGSPRAVRLYVGQGDGQLVVHRIGGDGSLTETSRLRTGLTPSFVAMRPDRRFAYAVSDGEGEVVALAVDPATGATTRLNARPSGGAGPTHVSVDRAGRHVLVANYGGGTVRVFPIEGDGSLGAPTDTEAAGANAHAIDTDPTDRWALVPCLGIDRVVVYAYDAGAGTLEPHGGHDAARGAGPRHLAFGAAHVYVVNELDSTVDVLALDAAAGTLSHVQTISTLPAGFSRGNSTAEILVHPRGDLVYASNRGHDSIAIFSIGGDGRLTARGHGMLMARTPRSMTITPDGARLYAGAQDDDRVIHFSIGADGALTRDGSTAVGAAASFVGAL